MKKIVPVWIFILAQYLSAQTQIFVLCEGNFQTPNATVWSFTDNLTGVDGPLYWSPNANPLGDTGQSMTINDHDLYIVMNNSHTIEKVDLSNGFTPVASLPVPGAGPRYLAIYNGTAFISTWNLSGLLVVDLSTFSITDTLVIPNAKTEQFLIQGSTLWVTSPMHMDWSTNDKVYQIQLDPSPTLVDSFTVVPGPTGIIGLDTTIFVSSTYYDANWNANSGTSAFIPSSGQVVTHEYGSSLGYDDLVVINGQVYRGVTGGLAPLTDDLSVDITAGYSVGGHVYAAAARDQYIYFATSNYTAPDTVTVMDTSSAILAQFAVGALPGSFAFYNPATVSTTPELPVPVNITVSSAYPNPFNPQVTLDYTMTQSGPVTITVTNLAGQTVSKLYNGWKEPGTYSIRWIPRQAASGVYIIQFRGFDTVIKRRVTLLK